MFITKWFNGLKESRIQKKRIKTVSTILRELTKMKPNSAPFQTTGLGPVDCKKSVEDMTQFTVKFSTTSFNVKLDTLIRASAYTVKLNGVVVFATVDQTIQFNGSLGLNDTEVYDELQFELFGHELFHTVFTHLELEI